MSRIAHCCCGALRAETVGEAAIIAMCHCTECQRRTGSPFGVGAYFKKDQVQVTGTSTVYVRRSDAGRQLQMHFCPRCGTTVYWELELRPDQYGIPIGAFADPSFPPPTRSVWEDTRHHWIVTDGDLPRFPQGASR